MVLNVCALILKCKLVLVSVAVNDSKSLQNFPPTLLFYCFLWAVFPAQTSQSSRHSWACVTAADVYHRPPPALSTERRMLARVQLCKSHLDVAFLINSLGALLPPCLFTPSTAPQAPLVLHISKQPLNYFMIRSS